MHWSTSFAFVQSRDSVDSYKISDWAECKFWIQNVKNHAVVSPCDLLDFVWSLQGVVVSHSQFIYFTLGGPGADIHD